MDKNMYIFSEFSLISSHSELRNNNFGLFKCLFCELIRTNIPFSIQNVNMEIKKKDGIHLIA